VNPNLPGGQQSVVRWFNTDAFVLNDPGTFGNSGRNTIIGPGIFRVDASIIRNFRLTSGKSVQFRLEVFNALNNPIWNDPNTTVGDPLYGTINSTRTPMREVQLGLKFVF
jgi:hypothetical protein